MNPLYEFVEEAKDEEAIVVEQAEETEIVIPIATPPSEIDTYNLSKTAKKKLMEQHRKAKMKEQREYNKAKKSLKRGKNLTDNARAIREYDKEREKIGIRANHVATWGSVQESLSHGYEQIGLYTELMDLAVNKGQLTFEEGDGIIEDENKLKYMRVLDTMTKDLEHYSGQLKELNDSYKERKGKVEQDDIMDYYAAEENISKVIMEMTDVIDPYAHQLTELTVEE